MAGCYDKHLAIFYCRIKFQRIFTRIEKYLEKNIRNGQIAGYDYGTVQRKVNEVDAIVGSLLLSIEKFEGDDRLFSYVDSRKLQETMEKRVNYQCITYED